MINRNIPVNIMISPARMKPLGFQASFLKTSDGPITSLSIAFAAEASIAALRLVRLMPPEPRNNSIPAMMKKSPSMKVAFRGETRGFEDRNRRSRAYTIAAIQSGRLARNIMFLRRFLLILLRL